MQKTLFLATTVSLLAFEAMAAQTEISIYNENLALIKKTQEVSLKQGINEVVFDEVAEQLKPESAFIYGNDIHVLEQNYDYAGINYQSLLNANIGKVVKTVRQNPETGANIYEKATLLAVNGDMPVLKFDYGIESRFPGRVLFDNVPQELNSTPVLMAKVEAKDGGNKNLNLAYLATGFNWQANYVASVNDDKTLSLLGRATLSNQSGSSYENVTVNLIAGDVNVVTDYMQPRMMKATRGVMMLNAMSEDKAVIDEPVSMDSYYIYKIPFNTTLKNGQMKQVSFLNATDVTYNKEGVLNSSLYFGNAKNYFKDVHPFVYYHFMNNKEDGLGMPLPAGKISFYAPDDKGSLQFIGEQRMDNKAEGQKISLQLGKFFDVYGEGKIVEAKKIAEKTYQKPQQKCLSTATTYHYDVVYQTVNKSQDEVHMLLKQPLNNEAKIIKTSLEGKAGDGNVYEWKFDLKAGEVKEITAEVESQFEAQKCD